MGVALFLLIHKLQPYIKLLMSTKHTAYIVIGFGVITIILSSVFFILTQHADFITLEGIGQYGAFIAGLVGSFFSLAGVLLLLENLKIQSKQIENQSTQFKKQQFEGRFFELLKIHIQILASMEHSLPNYSSTTVKKGRVVILEIFNQFKMLWRDALNDSILRAVRKDKLMAAVYLLVFYGVSDDSIPTLETYLKESISEIEIEQLIKKAEGYKREDMRPEKFFGGHQSRLGHYFRHIYQIVKYIHATPLLNEKDKKNYVKMIRAQSSDPEQALFFLNSLTPLGRKWAQKDPNSGKKLIEEYELIKNIHPNYIPSIDPSDYYTMNYEHSKPQRSLGRSNSS